MNKTTIDWPGLTHTWNPGYGCLRNCSYCYARELHNKRMRAKKEGAKLAPRYGKPFYEMQFFPQDLKIVKKSRIVKKVFVGSMTDICYWNVEWMNKVLRVIRARPGIEFMFLTKDPRTYRNYEFPINCWLGATVTNKKDYNKIIYLPPFNYSFVSIEPILGSFEGDRWFDIDLVIVGAQSGENAVTPKKEWIESIKHPNIHYKENIKACL